MDERQQLLDLLVRAQARGLVGPGPVTPHLEHALAWAGALGPAPDSFVDLGSGAGVPGLVLAAVWPEARAMLLDARQRAAEWLRLSVEELGWESRVDVVETRAEEAGRDPARRERFALVVARGFGSPAETAECATALAAVGGRVSVSEPPGGDPGRWPAEGLVELALRPATMPATEVGSFVVFTKSGPLSDRYPRRTGKPHHRPLW